MHVKQEAEMKRIFTNSLFALILLAGVMFGGVKASAVEPGPVSVRDINYEDLTMKVYKNGNSCVYYTLSLSSSIELSDWDEVSGESVTDATGTYILMDISWTTATADTKFYLRGDKNTETVQVKLPKQTTAFKVKFDKIIGNFVFLGQDDRAFFYYRKSTDYNWTKVMFDGYSAADTKSYADFLLDVEVFRFKGAKLMFKLGQEVGMATPDSTDFGERPSKEVSVTVSKYVSAPAVKLNVTKLIFNTKDTMEWTTDIRSTSWTPCVKDTKIEDIAPDSIWESSSKPTDTVLFFRSSQTEKKACSQIMVVNVPAQSASPTVGEKGTEDVVYAYVGNRITLTFKNASKEIPYEYCIVKDDGNEFDIHTAKWKTVSSAKAIILTAKSTNDSTIYIRRKGKNAVASKSIDMVLPSDYETIDVSFAE